MSWPCLSCTSVVVRAAAAFSCLVLAAACSAGVDADSDAPEFSGTLGGGAMSAPGTGGTGTTAVPGSNTPTGVNPPSSESAPPTAGTDGSSPTGAPGAGGSSTNDPSSPATPGETPAIPTPPASDPAMPTGDGSEDNPSNTPDPGGTFGLGGDSRCASAGLAICEGFESTALGSSAVPGWLPAGYGNRTLQVVDVEKARGARALQVDVAENQGAVVGMLSRGNLGALSARHFGRSFLKIQAPAPTGFVHFDVFEARGSFNGQDNLVRWASTGTNVGTGSSNWSWIYNVQSTDHGEFGSEGPRSAHPREGDWMCLEWMMDSGAQEAQFWMDGAEVDYLHIDTERSEIPAFTNFNIGFQKFQQTGAWRVWVDEVAFDAERIGCDG